MIDYAMVPWKSSFGERRRLGRDAEAEEGPQLGKIASTRRLLEGIRCKREVEGGGGEGGELHDGRHKQALNQSGASVGERRSQRVVVRTTSFEVCVKTAASSRASRGPHPLQPALPLRSVKRYLISSSAPFNWSPCPGSQSHRI